MRGKGTPTTGIIPTTIDTLTSMYIKKINPIEETVNLANSVLAPNPIENT